MAFPVLIYGWPPPNIGLTPLYQGMRNGIAVPGGNLRRLAGYINSCSALRRKVLFSHSIRPSEAYNASTADTTTWRFRFHTGVVASTIGCRFVMIPTDDTEVNAPYPRCYWTTTPDGSGSTSQPTVTMTSRATAGGGLTPDDYVTHEQNWSSITANAFHQAELHVVDRCRVIACTVWQQPISSATSSASGLIDIAPFAETLPIYDAHATDIHDTLRDIWKRNGTDFVSWSQKASTPSSVTGTTWTNIWSGSTNPFGTTTAGAYLRPKFCGSFDSFNSVTSREVIPCAFYAVLASSNAAANARLRFQDSIGTVATLQTTATTATWVTTTANWTIDTTNADYKIDFQASSDTAGQTSNVYALGMFSYEA